MHKLIVLTATFAVTFNFLNCMALNKFGRLKQTMKENNNLWMIIETKVRGTFIPKQ